MKVYEPLPDPTPLLNVTFHGERPKVQRPVQPQPVIAPPPPARRTDTQDAVDYSREYGSPVSRDGDGDSDEKSDDGWDNVIGDYLAELEDPKSTHKVPCDLTLI